MVWEVGEPAAAPIEKSGAFAAPDNGTVWCLPVALSAMIKLPLKFPLEVGVNVTPIEQVAPARTEPQSFDVMDWQGPALSGRSFGVASPSAPRVGAANLS
jgi:hypothetical protein